MLTYGLEVVGHLELVLLVGNISLDFRVGVVDDSQEHVQEHEEDKEHVEHKVGRAKDPVGLLQFVEVEIAKDDAEQRETAKANAFYFIFIFHI